MFELLILPEETVFELSFGRSVCQHNGDGRRQWGRLLRNWGKSIDFNLLSLSLKNSTKDWLN